ncbi:MAG: tRNA (adenosine(37)-N6)-threonylcarbamoyltransferase complex ATPase subunit type 1 TsaE [Myxococcales bacterium]|nr:tRNA (adenosine(37)-N6)-threonylcarbamoyltransferase complex ATPase subunit type 1 TsaE [Myxococcales bacterium]
MSSPSITLASLAAVEACARALAPYLRHGDVVLLRGDVGVGKTTWVQALATALGIAGPVTSPTFALIQGYEDGSLPLWHADLYRIERAAEVANLGLDDIAGERGVLCVEWPQLWLSSWPHEAWLAHLDLSWSCDEAGVRTVRIGGRGERGEALAHAWLQELSRAAPAEGAAL